MVWKVQGWHPSVVAPEEFDTGDEAHARARQRAIEARRQVGVFHGVPAKTGRIPWSKIAAYGKGAGLLVGSATWRPLDEKAAADEPPRPG